MRRVLFEFKVPFDFFIGIDSVKIYSYPTFILIGFLLFSQIVKYYERKNNIKFLTVNYVFIVFVSSLIGGKLFYLFENFTQNFENLSSKNITKGFVFYGAFIFSLISSIVYFKIKKISILKALDILAIGLPLLHGFSRIGCFMAGCCYGSETYSRLGVIFPKTYPVKVHPTQLYEASFLFCLFFILLKCYNLKKENGQIFLMYLTSYSVFRFFIEKIRGNNVGFLTDLNLTHSQLIAIFIFVFVLFYTFFYSKCFLKNKF